MGEETGPDRGSRAGETVCPKPQERRGGGASRTLTSWQPRECVGGTREQILDGEEGVVPNETKCWGSLKAKLGGRCNTRAGWRGGWHPVWVGRPASARAHPSPLTDRMPVLLAFPMKFSAKQVYLPSSDRLMFLMVKVPSGVTVTLQHGESRSGQPTLSSRGGAHLQGGRGGAGIARGAVGIVPAAVDQNLGAFAPKHHGLRSCPGLTRDHDLSPTSRRDQTPYGVQPEVRGQCWKERRAPQES